MRLIDADALKEAIKNQHWKPDTRMQLTLKWIDMLINEAPIIESPRPDWTPCADGMPEEHEQAYPVYDEKTFAVIDARYEMVSDVCAVTVKNPNGGIFSATDLTVNGKWETYERMEEDHTVLAWQPLPEPYRADDTTGKPDHIVDANKKVQED